MQRSEKSQRSSWGEPRNDGRFTIASWRISPSDGRKDSAPNDGSTPADSPRAARIGDETPFVECV